MLTSVRSRTPDTPICAARNRAPSQPARLALLTFFTCSACIFLAGCGSYKLNLAKLPANQSTIPVITWLAPSPIVFGTALSATQLNATANALGVFTYSPSLGTVLSTGSQTLAVTFTPTDTADYNSASASVELIVNGMPPSLNSQPQDQSVTLGQPATFTVTATGQAPLGYQWQRSSSFISGATSSTYTTPPTTAADDGATFNVVVFNANASVTSNSASLAVASPVLTGYYVATSGSDNSDGSESAPFATLQRAQAAMRQSSTKVTQINAGTYYLSTPLVLTGLDQGETWEAVPGAIVVLSGGEILQGWTSEGNGIYSTVAAQPVGLDLTISDVRQMPADLGYDPERPFTSGWRMVTPNQAQGAGTANSVVPFNVLPDDLTPSVKPGALVQVLDSYRYTDSFATIVSVDATSFIVTVADPFPIAYAPGGQGGGPISWRVLGDPADLSAVGQFAFDPATAKVYVQPVNPGSLATDTVVAAQLSTLISVNGVSGITISGLTFSATTSDRQAYAGAFGDLLGTIMGTGLSNSTISGNTFLNVGNGISLIGSSNNSITGNKFDQIGGSGIYLVNNSNQNSVTNNALTGLGKINAGSTGIHILSSAFNSIDENMIDGSGRWGIDLYPNDGASMVGNVVSNNLIRNTSQQTNDSGAIYSYAGNSSSYVNENTTISGNRIENVGSLTRNGSGDYGTAGMAQGIYMDARVSGVRITGNVIESGGAGVLLCSGCQSNSADNNVVVLQAAAIYDRGSKGTTFASGDMMFSGVTRIDLLPSYFPVDAPTSTIVVQLSGQSSGGTSARFDVQADGNVIGTGMASNTVADYVFLVPLTPHQIHRIGIALTNGASAGTPTTALLNLALFVNNTAVQLSDPEALNGVGAYGFLCGEANSSGEANPTMVTNFSITHNLVYRNGGVSGELSDWTNLNFPSYVDPNPGTIDDNVLYQGVAKAIDPVFGLELLDAHSLLNDQLFTNASEGNYSLQGNSPAYTVGFITSGVPLAP
jgi:parallel beta-helix repeat protein